MPSLYYAIKLSMNNPKTTHRLGNLTGSNGGADPDRTGDPLLAKQVLSQLSYSPENSVC